MEKKLGRMEKAILLTLYKHPDGMTKEALMEEVENSGLLEMSDKEFRRHLRETVSPNKTTFLKKIWNIFGN
jgi:hypothetical protein